MKKVARHKSITDPDNLRTTISRNAMTQPQINNLSEIPIDFFAFLDEIAIGVLTLSLDRKLLGLPKGLLAATDILSGEEFDIMRPILLPAAPEGRLDWVRGKEKAG